MTPWLAIVGIGEDGLDGLSQAARALVDGAELLVGDDRLLAMVPEDGRMRLTWPKPLRAVFPEIERRRGQPVCVLASGDPLHYGIGSWLVQHFGRTETRILPAPSAFSLACARLGWSRAEVECLSLHGRPAATLNAFVQPGMRLLSLTTDGTAAAAVAAVLRARGFGPSRIAVLERLGGPAERVIEGTASGWAVERTDALNTLAIECVAGPEAIALPRIPGLPDEAFRHDGKLTKREARAATLAALAPLPGQLLWDVGAGCGSIGIEWVRSGPRLRAIAIELDHDRVAMIGENATALGAAGLTIVTGKAPEALAGLDPPDAVFIGGGLTVPGLIDACCAALRPGGRLVANAVTLQGERQLHDLYARLGGDLTRIAISRIAPVGALVGWRPLMPVMQYCLVKP